MDSHVIAEHEILSGTGRISRKKEHSEGLLGTIFLEDGVSSLIPLFSDFLKDPDGREVVLIDHVPYPVHVRV